MTRRRNVEKRKSGFTLVEVLIVMTIVGILAGIALPHYRGVIEKADATAIISDANMIAKAAFQVQAETGTIPRNRGWRVTPPELRDLLPAGFVLEHGQLAMYRWRRWVVSGSGARARRLSSRGIEGTTVGIQVRSDNQELIRALDALWTGPSFGNRRNITLLFQGGA